MNGEPSTFLGIVSFVPSLYHYVEQTKDTDHPRFTTQLRAGSLDVKVINLPTELALYRIYH